MIANIHGTIEDYAESLTWREFPSEPHASFEEMYTAVKDELFDFNFPWYATNEEDPSLSTKEEFKRMFILRFWRNQYKAETMGDFKRQLNARLTQEMPRFRELYKTLLIEYDPLINQDWEEQTHDKLKGKAEEEFIQKVDDDFKETKTEKDTEKTTTDDSYTGKTDHDLKRNTTGNDQSIHSDNPQVNFSGNDYASSMDRGQQTGNESVNEHTNTKTQEDIEVDRLLNHTESTNNERDIGTNHTKENEKEDDRNVNVKHKGYSGNDKTANIESFRMAILNLNKWLCDICDGIYPYKIYGNAGESTQFTLFMEYFGEGITLTI